MMRKLLLFVARCLLGMTMKTGFALAQNQNPYHIWVSEIMLQQTQVVTVIPYYRLLLAWFPTVDALAKAPEEKLLKRGKA